MTGGESRASGTGLDALLLDFMRVIAAQHQFFYSSAISENNAAVKLDLTHTASLYESLRLHPQSISTQWLLIIKLYRLACLKEINFHYNGDGEWNAEGFLNNQFDYKLMDSEVELVLLPENFTRTLADLEGSLSSVITKKAVTYTCKVYLRDNRVYLVINDYKFQVARPNSGSIIDDLLRQLERQPSLEPLTAANFKPELKDLDFDRVISKYKYDWLRPMLPLCDTKVISIQNPAQLAIDELRSMLPNIAENYRQPIAQYLGIDSSDIE